MLRRIMQGLLAVSATLLPLTLSAAPEGMCYVGVDTGYRWDKISNRATLFGPSVTHEAASQVAREIQSYQLGVKGQWEYCQFVAKGVYHHGWVGHGQYNEAGFFGKLDGHTNDVLAGLGYLLPTNRCWTLTAFAGWSYDQLDVTGKNIKAPQGGRFVNVGNIHYESTIQGPWVGTDILLRPLCGFSMLLGHELHYGWWHGTRHLRSGELGTSFGQVTGFSNKREHHNLWGNVFRIEGTYTLSECWDLGLNFKYQRWFSSRNGHYKRTEVPLDPVYTSPFIEDVEWQSFSVGVCANYVF